MASRRARERANSRPWEAGEEPDDETTGDWSDGTGEGMDEGDDDEHAEDLADFDANEWSLDEPAAIQKGRK